jgi:hypothetical protein
MPSGCAQGLTFHRGVTRRSLIVWHSTKHFLGGGGGGGKIKVIGASNPCVTGCCDTHMKVSVQELMSVTTGHLLPS